MSAKIVFTRSRSFGTEPIKFADIMETVVVSYRVPNRFTTTASTQLNAIAKADRALVLHSGVPPMLWCAGAGSWYSGVVGSTRARKGSS